jgi:hypothetical protein
LETWAAFPFPGKGMMAPYLEMPVAIRFLREEGLREFVLLVEADAMPMMVHSRVAGGFEAGKNI